MRPNSAMQTTRVSSSMPSAVEVGDQGGEGAVGRRYEDVFQPVGLVGVGVPDRERRRFVGAAIPVHLDQPHARLDQPAREQAALADRRPAVAVVDRVRFLFQAERLARLGRAEQVERLAGLLVEGRGGRVVVEERQSAGDLFAEGAAGLDALDGQAVGQVDLADAIAAWRDLGVEEPGIGRPAEEPGVLPQPLGPLPC